MAQAHGGPTAQSPTETVTPAPDNHVAQLFGRDSLAASPSWNIAYSSGGTVLFEYTGG
jgi:hypothetical protein